MRGADTSCATAWMCLCRAHHIGYTARIDRSDKEDKGTERRFGKRSDMARSPQVKRAVGIPNGRSL